ncbi:hypothetical protein FH972_020160 [Carpinus fangiana]|uniref:Legume lectin domain-containing protein n=1 Tax=Carpinus fangiana TaxID=176857 RepID=A0A5N6RVJ2_9ROSI|nr:hypothetical protein FH972_020160 [Carpinus fangiana]
MSFSRAFESLFLALLLLGGGILTQVGCLKFDFPEFPDPNTAEMITQKLNSSIYLGAIQVTPDNRNENLDHLVNKSGRALYEKPFRLWSKRKGVTASFSTTFQLNIKNLTNPGGEGLAFILAADPTLPEGSDGQWLGIVNASTDGFSQVVAVEFDTRQSYREDLEDFHVGLDVNSIYSIEQVSLRGNGITLANITSGNDTWARVEYDGEHITVSVNGTGEYMPVISRRLNLSDHLPEMVYVGFSASTSNYIELNCVRSWEFDGDDIDEGLELLWVWITIPAVLIVIISGIVFYLFWERKHREQPEDAYPRIEDQIRGSSMAPRNYNNGIVYWLWELRRKDKILDAVDSKLAGQFDEDEMVGMLVLGLACCHPNPHERPSMKTVLQVLKGEALPPLLPAERPAFVWPAMPPSFKEDTDNAFIKSQLLTPFTELGGR